MAETKSKAGDIAASLQKGKLGMKLGVFSFWGMMPVQPNEFAYTLKDAKADGSRLDLTLLGYDDEPSTLSVHEPHGFTGAKESLLIKGAARITWQSWDCRVEGKTLRVRGGASTDEGSRPVSPKDPALSLKRV